MVENCAAALLRLGPEDCLRNAQGHIDAFGVMLSRHDQFFESLTVSLMG